MSLRVAIIGAGPAGCLLARMCYVNNIAFTVFEAEPSLDHRNQGGTLDLHPKTGIAAIKAAGLYEEFLKVARFEGSALTICDKSARPYFQLPRLLAANPEVDRLELRLLLLRSIPAESICWNHRLRQIDHQDGSLCFEGGGAVQRGFDLVVGADGAWSRVRASLTPTEPTYSGIAGYDLTIPNAREAAPDSDRLVGRGSLFAFSGGQSIIGQQMGDGSIHVSVWSRRANAAWAREKRNQQQQQQQQQPSRDEICAEHPGWTSELLDLVRHTEGAIRTSAFYMLPLGFRWPHRRGVTLVGDAAHLMTPFAGEGVNIALDDAKRLADVIVANARGGVRRQLDGVALYEKEMFRRADRAQSLTYNMMQCMYFSPGAPRATIERWVILRASYDCNAAVEPLLRPFLAAGVYGFYMIFKRFV
ncbi:hypothetical protein ARAM_006070 [Aspergillus rambellii]|uniref:FAD-binding domain-containing protein n=1 Tax=Aspergillus rambellii TaxID=308745 RepID=A0A0F8XLI8_9EURO|nr:hypothetical protein ARAM_006070 [Aspergillus rambellii]